MKCLIDGDWRPVVGYEESYVVSNLGEVRSVDRLELMSGRHPQPYYRKRKGKTLKPNTSTGYAMVSLYKDGEQRQELVHRVVGKAFLPNPDNLPEINHIDENKLNNGATNLEWKTSQGNSLHSVYKTTGELCGTSKLTERNVHDIAYMLEESHMTLEQIGEQFGVTAGCIYRIKAGDNWSWLTGFGKGDTQYESAN